MKTFIIICGILPFIMMAIVTTYNRHKLNLLDRKIYDDGFGNGVLTGSFFLLIIVVIICASDDPRPTALDVYRNKTELEITYKNTTPVDSTVIWKK